MSSRSLPIVGKEVFLLGVTDNRRYSLLVALPVFDDEVVTLTVSKRNFHIDFILVISACERLYGRCCRTYLWSEGSSESNIHQ